MNALPAELTAHVLHYLAKRRDIAAASTVCYRFYDILLPVLYRHPTIAATEYDEAGHVQMRRFVHTISQRPALGLLVKSLEISNIEYGEGDHEIPDCNFVIQDETWRLTCFPDSARDDIRELVSAAKEKGLRNGIILSGGSRGQFIFLLHYLQNLRSLSCECTGAIVTIAYAALGCYYGGVPIGLQSIKSLRLGYDDAYGGFCTEAVVPFLALPELSDVRVLGFTGEDHGHEPDFVQYEGKEADEAGNAFEWHKMRSAGFDEVAPIAGVLQTQSSNVTRLRFDNSVVDCQLLGRILAILRQLKRFYYGVGGEDVSSTPLIPRLLYKGLRTQVNSLTELIITDDDEPALRSDDLEDDQFIGSLREFVALRHLRLPSACLIHPSMKVPKTPVARSPLDALLPPSLVSLELEVQGRINLLDFLKVTGVPRTLTATARSLPALKTFYLGDEYHTSLETILHSVGLASWPIGHAIRCKIGPSLRDVRSEST